MPVIIAIAVAAIGITTAVLIKKGIFKKDIIPGIAKRAFFGALDEMSRFWVLSSRRKYDIETAAKQISGYFLSGLVNDAKA